MRCASRMKLPLKGGGIVCQPEMPAAHAAALSAQLFWKSYTAAHWLSTVANRRPRAMIRYSG